MNPDRMDYKRFYDRVGALNGWDFSRIKCTVEGAAWDFYREVTESCTASDVLLDIGCGGGEAVLSIADQVLLLVGIDGSKGMIQTANANLKNSAKTNVRFCEMEAEQLRFPDCFFDAISCRHAEFYAKEAARVLVKDGIFLTQQVSEHDKINLKHAFGRGQSLSIPEGTLKNKYVSELSEAGFREIRTFEYDAAEYYESHQDLVFLLKHTPIIPNFGQEEDDFAVLEQFIETNRTDKGIKTNARRFMIIAKK